MAHFWGLTSFSLASTLLLVLLGFSLATLGIQIPLLVTVRPRFSGVVIPTGLHYNRIPPGAVT
jgi:hypothetical protein